MIQIGEFSKMAQVTVKTLRHYDKQSLLKPLHIDVMTGYRYYSTEQVYLLHRIIHLKQSGFSLKDIKLMLSGAGEEPFLENQKNRLKEEIKIFQEKLQHLEYYIKTKENPMKYTAVLGQTPECRVYSKRFTAPDFDSYFKILPAIGEEVAAAYPNIKCSASAYCFIAYHDKEFKDVNVDVEYCEAIENPEVIKEWGKTIKGITFKKLPSVPAVSVMHKGPYEGLIEAWSFILRWLEENGYEAVEAGRERYIDGCWNKENPEDWLTELQVPVRKK